MAWIVFFLGCWSHEAIRIVSPEAGVFAGRTVLKVDVDFVESEVLGIEVLANNQQVAYFDARPFETELDFRDLPSGPLVLKAVVTLFDGRRFETTAEGVNYPKLYEEEVNLVRIPVLVQMETLEQERLGLSAFELRENGTLQVLEKVLSVDQPLELLVLLDLSGSMEKRLAMVRKGMQRLLESLKPEDRIHIVGFNTVVFEIFSASNDHQAAMESLNWLQASGETNLHGAIWGGIKMLSQVNLRRALVVFTDGRHEMTATNDGTRSLEECLGEAQSKGIPIYTLGCGAGIDPKTLSFLAESSGGKFFRLKGGTAIQAAFEDVGRQLRKQYLVCYQSKAFKAGWKEINVVLKPFPSAVLHYPERVYLRSGL